MCSGVAVVDERGAERAGDMAMLPLGPDAHQELDVVQGPGTALEVPIGPDELLGVSSVHAYVPLVVLVEIAPDPDDVSWAARMEREAKAAAWNEWKAEREAYLAFQREQLAEKDKEIKELHKHISIVDSCASFSWC